MAPDGGAVDRGAVVPLRPEPAVLPASGIADDFVELYRSHYPRVVRALRLSGASEAEAEDLAQEAFARTLGHFWRVRRGTNPPGYVYRVAFRLLRRPRRELAGLEDHELAVIPAIDAETTTRLLVEAAITAMPPGRRTCAVLCLVAGLSPNEAGRALRIAPSTVRKQLERARADLRAALSDLDGDRAGPPLDEAPRGAE